MYKPTKSANNSMDILLKDSQHTDDSNSSNDQDDCSALMKRLQFEKEEQI